MRKLLALALASLASVAGAPAAAVSPRDADAAQAACTAAAHQRRIDVRAVRNIRSDGARRISVELVTDNRRIVLCRWDHLSGRVDFPNREGFVPRPPPVEPALPPIEPAPVPRPQAALPQRPPQAGPVDPAARDAAVLLCQDLAHTRLPMDTPPPPAVAVRHGPDGTYDVDMKSGSMSLYCRSSIERQSATWR